MSLLLPSCRWNFKVKIRSGQISLFVPKGQRGAFASLRLRLERALREIFRALVAMRDLHCTINAILLTDRRRELARLPGTNSLIRLQRYGYHEETTHKVIS
jgi:hypothetical protein